MNVEHPGRMNYLFAGNSLRENGHLDQAIYHYNCAIQLDSKFAAAYFERGLAHVSLGERDEAIGDFSLAINNSANYCAAFRARAAVQFERGMYLQTVDDCTQAIRINPEEGSAYTLRGNAYMKLGDTDRGFDDLEMGGQIEAKRLCLVCMEGQRGARLHPCMHSGLCAPCATNFHTKNIPCPLCNGVISHVEFGLFKDTFTFDPELPSPDAQKVPQSPMLTKIRSGFHLEYEALDTPNPHDIFPSGGETVDSIPSSPSRVL
eukprot:CAMPEP_0114254724 /NCGR_PEP_ID=MMETSP0058-20121206/17158_1 /TAXON_ID=36894 /ORGANISM="Pyramimonas parkeae, CCMP726" /LENGTH=260 /DNA_ID=CAMNT_0001369015 /DNA_START=160 /DNA_END=942 /DNA_ORIENTATION=+